MPASRSVRAMIFAPRSCPSRPGLATTTRIRRLLISPPSLPSAGGRRAQQGHGSGLGFSGREEHEQLEALLDRVEAMVDPLADEHDRTGADGAVLAGHLDLRAAGDHVVDLVLGVRRLRVLAP